MGIVYSTFAPTAVRLAYICQKLFDPKYSCIEDVQSTSSNGSQPAAAEVSPSPTATAELQVQQSTSLVTAKVELQPAQLQESALVQPATLMRTRIQAVKSNSLPRYSNAKSPDYNYYSVHQQNRARRARQLRYKTRPSSFDGQLIIRAKTKNAVIVTSTPSRHWDALTSSSSGCSSDSNSNTDSDSETELRVSHNASNEEIGNNLPKLAMTAEDEADFRLTLGRGHFSKSKKDRFLNNLRLQKASTAASLW